MPNLPPPIYQNGPQTMNKAFGKFYAKTFTGSMYGAGPTRFALWSYCVANAMPPDGSVELNPKQLAPMIGMTEPQVADAIDYLCAPDPSSRTPADEGRRLRHVSAFEYRLVNFSAHRAGTDNDARREYWRDRQREHRQTVSNGVKRSVNDSQGQSVTITQAEAEAEAEAEKDLLSADDVRRDSEKALKKALRETAKDILEALNQKAGREFRPTDGNLKLISERLREVTGDALGILKMIDRQCARWKSDPHMAEFLRPSTLFQKGKFGEYYDLRDVPVIESSTPAPQPAKQPTVWELSKALEVVEEKIAAIKRRGWEDAWGLHIEDKDEAEYNRLRAERKKLKEKIAGNVQ